jgi:LCP family protein required for cell wall assembly
MEKRSLNSKIILCLGIAVILILAGLGAYLLYQRPLGPALESLDISASVSTVPTQVAPASAATLLPEAASAPEATGTAEPTAKPAPTEDKTAVAISTSSPRKVCGENEAWNILVLGSDASESFGTPGSDLTRVLRVDFPNRKVTIFAFSRDLLMDASELDFRDPDITITKLGMVFFEARVRSTEVDPKDVMQDGVNAMAETLAANFGLHFDHYIALDQDMLPVMVDTIGGLPISIPVAIIDPRTGVEFQAGQQVLDGELTIIYARAHKGSDLDRIERNNLLIEALRQKVLDPAIWFKLPSLFMQFREAINSDLSLEQVNHLVCLLKEVEEDAILQEGVLEEWTTPGPEGSLLWDEAKVLGRLEELNMLP